MYLESWKYTYLCRYIWGLVIDVINPRIVIIMCAGLVLMWLYLALLLSEKVYVLERSLASLARGFSTSVFPDLSKWIESRWHESVKMHAALTSGYEVKL